VKSAGLSGSTKGALVLNHPDDLRIDLVTPFNTPLAYIATDGNEINAWVQRNNVFFRGEDASAVFSKLMGGQTEITGALKALTGCLPIDNPVPSQTTIVNGDLQFTFPMGDDGALVVQVDPNLHTLSHLQVLSRQTTSELTPVLEVDYDNHSPIEDGVLLPNELAIRFPSLQWDVALKFRSWTVTDLASDIFTITPPQGAVEQDLVEVLQNQLLNDAD